MRRVAIIQARMSSSRLFGKVMLPLGDKSVLEQVIQRVSAAEVDDVVVATSTDNLDKHILALCNKQNINTYAGSLHNVLSRYYEAAKLYKADIIVRVTSDCPLYDKELLNTMMCKFENYDYFTNTIKRTFPRGLDIEIFTFEALQKSYQNAANPQELEHVTPYIYQNKNIFNCKNYENDTNLANHRWTLDTKEDYLMINSVYESLGSNATTAEIVRFLEENPSTYQINSEIAQKES